MPALLSSPELEALQRKVQGATRERMLREMAEALEALTVEWPLVLVLEDLHWSDSATLDLVSFLARRRQPARLLVVGTYRPVEVIIRELPYEGSSRNCRSTGCVRSCHWSHSMKWR
jgi:predicted ATPase